MKKTIHTLCAVVNKQILFQIYLTGFLHCLPLSDVLNLMITTKKKKNKKRKRKRKKKRN